MITYDNVRKVTTGERYFVLNYNYFKEYHKMIEMIFKDL